MLSLPLSRVKTLFDTASIRLLISGPLATDSSPTTLPWTTNPLIFRQLVPYTHIKTTRPLDNLSPVSLVNLI